MAEMEITVKEIRDIFIANMDKRLRITCVDDAVQSVDINVVDDEGFLHIGSDRIEQRFWWTIFDEIKSIKSD